MNIYHERVRNAAVTKWLCKTRLGIERRMMRSGNANEEGRFSSSFSLFSLSSYYQYLYLFNEQKWDKYI